MTARPDDRPRSAARATIRLYAALENDWGRVLGTLPGVSLARHHNVFDQGPTAAGTRRFIFAQKDLWS